MKTLNYITGLLLFVVTAVLLVAGNLAMQFAVYYPKAVAYFTKRRYFTFRRREPVGFSF